MAKKSAKPAYIEPEDESQEIEADEPEGRDVEGAGRERVSKAEAIRRALADGMETPEEGVAFIDKHFGLDVSRQHFSAAKSQMKKKDATTADVPKGKPGRKPRAESQGIETSVARQPSPTPGAGESDLLAAMEAMKPLVAALGADKVKRLADLLG